MPITCKYRNGIYNNCCLICLFVHRLYPVDKNRIDEMAIIDEQDYKKKVEWDSFYAWYYNITFILYKFDYSIYLICQSCIESELLIVIPDMKD